MRLLRKLLADRTGGSAVEYAFIAALIAAGSMVAVQGLGASVGSSYDDTATAMHNAQT